MINGKLAIDPGFVDALDFHRRDGDMKLRVCVPGTITSFDPVQRTANILPGYNRVYNDGTVVPMSELIDFPVLTVQGGGVVLGLPIKAGDECFVIISDISLDAWFTAGGQQTPITAGRHKISDGFALVGVNSMANPLDSALTAQEGGLAAELAKVAINPLTEMVTIANGPLPANNLNGILQVFLAAVAASSVLDAPTKTAASDAALALATLLY